MSLNYTLTRGAKGISGDIHELSVNLGGLSDSRMREILFGSMPHQNLTTFQMMYAPLTKEPREYVVVIFADGNYAHASTTFKDIYLNDEPIQKFVDAIALRATEYVEGLIRMARTVDAMVYLMLKSGETHVHTIEQQQERIQRDVDDLRRAMGLREGSVTAVREEAMNHIEGIRQRLGTETRMIDELTISVSKVIADMDRLSSRIEALDKRPKRWYHRFMSSGK